MIKMKKVAIVTLYGNYNYGNKFQNYAVQEILKSFGYEADTLVFSLNTFKDLGRIVKRGLRYCFGDKEMKRYRSLKRFSDEMLNVRYIYAKDGVVSSKLKKKYSFFFVGSDQVWNPEIRVKERDIFFLDFADVSQRICISPSLGVKSIEHKYESKYKNGLKGFNYLCCREKEGAAEIERLSGKECLHLIDPTMALEPEKWRSFATRKMSNRNYILCFFLGDFNETLKEKILLYAREKNLELIIPSDPTSSFYTNDPREMVDLIENAKLVFTDSFHFCAFSIILNRPFWVFDRYSSSSITNNINSRIISLVNLFDLRERYTDINISDFSKTCDFTKANKQLILERKKFNDYMELCLSQKQREENE